MFDLREGQETFVLFKISRPTPCLTLPSIEWKKDFSIPIRGKVYDAHVISTLKMSKAYFYLST